MNELESPAAGFYAALERFTRVPLASRLASCDPQDFDHHLSSWWRQVHAQVPAYRRFLAQQGLAEIAVYDTRGFQKLPLMTKDNYMRAFPLAERCRGGMLAGCDMVAVSSGSTGAPAFWPRNMRDEFDIATRFEQVFVDSFRADRKATLAIVCFALGTWVGGMYTTHCCRLLSLRGYPVTVVTPGNNKGEIFRVVRELAHGFEQIVLLGYPPFVKDVIDSGVADGISWQDFNVKFVFAGEVFSEEWRQRLCERVGADDVCATAASLYGTADGGVLGNETPLSVAIRRLLARFPAAAAELFSEARLPTLVQYDPRSRYFEVHDGTLVVSGDAGVPLVRYHIADSGGLIPFQVMMEFLRTRIHDLDAELSTVQAYPARPLPFVYVFGRADFTVSYFGANIYPENVAVGLERSDVHKWLTGKFVLNVREGSQGPAELVVVAELAPDEAPSELRERALAQAIVAELRRLNSEFANYVPAEFQLPRVVLRTHGDPQYFPLGVKHRYTRKPSN
jgi:phenylacetate-CoA ligase